MYLILIAFISILACWQRKAGMLFSLGILLVFIIHFSPGWRLRFIGIILLIVSLVFLYGYFGTPNMIGERPGLSFFVTNLDNFSNAISAWFLPLSFPWRARMAMLVIILSVLIWGVHNYYVNATEKEKVYLLTLIIVASAYLIVRMFYQRPHFDEADRFLSPVFPTFWILVSLTLKSIHKHLFTRKSKVVFSIILLLWLFYPTIRIVKNAHSWHNRSKKPLTLKKETEITTNESGTKKQLHQNKDNDRLWPGHLRCVVCRLHRL
jgi:hypothetical protein